MFAASMLLVLVDRIPIVRYVFLAVALASYIFFGPKGSDHVVYEKLFDSNCNGLVVKGFEPLYQLSSRIFGSIFGCDKLDIFVIANIWFAMLALVFVLPNTLSSRVRFYFVSTLILYLVTFQYAYNFRTGISSSYLLIMFFTVSLVPKYAMGLAAITTHIQTLPAVIFGLFARSRGHHKIYFLLIAMGILLFYSPYFVAFVLQQGTRYLENFSGKVRATALPYLLIYVFVLRNYIYAGLPELKPFIWFGFLINVAFIFNAHIAGRLTKGIEPLLLGLLLLIIFSKRSLSSSLRVNFLLVQVPGLVFWVLVMVFS